MTGPRPGTIAFLGLGLIGGSIARALNVAANRTGAGPRPWTVAWTPEGRGPARAVEAGEIDVAAATPEEALAAADLVVIAAPPLATIALIERLGTDLRSALPTKAVITDVASTKGAVIAAASASGLRFVGGHPMAGREDVGFESARPDLFEARPWVVVRSPGTDDSAEALVRWLIEACGARPVVLDAAAHDAAVAAISHLPLIASAALVEAVAGGSLGGWPVARPLAASGWDGMTRLARGDAQMGAGIAATNAPALVAALRAYREAIDGWIAALEVGEPDPADLERRLGSARALLRPDRDGA